ncbi:MAG: PEP-CTERM sorting domain-containing protein [Verrucomicrobiota bacterium]
MCKKLLPCSKITRILPAAIVGAVLLVSNKSSANLLFYEGFDYTANQTYIGQNGGSGFSTAWQANSTANGNAMVLSGSLTYTDQNGHALVTAGNRGMSTGDGTASGSNTGGTTGNGQVVRQISVAGNPGGVALGSNGVATTWISLMAQRTDLPFVSSGGAYLHGRAGSLQLFSGVNATGGAGSENLSVGRASQNSETTIGSLPDDTWSIFNAGNANGQKASNLSFLDPAFILIRIDHVGTVSTTAGNADTAYVWYNLPDLSVEPSIGTADTTISSSEFASTRDYAISALRIFGGSRNTTVGYGQIDVDEIRGGTTFTDVSPFTSSVPEPATGMILGFGILGMLLRKRA